MLLVSTPQFILKKKQLWWIFKKSAGSKKSLHLKIFPQKGESALSQECWELWRQSQTTDQDYFGPESAAVPATATDTNRRSHQKRAARTERQLRVHNQCKLHDNKRFNAVTEAVVTVAAAVNVAAFTVASVIPVAATATVAPATAADVDTNEQQFLLLLLLLLVLLSLLLRRCFLCGHWSCCYCEADDTCSRPHPASVGQILIQMYFSLSVSFNF